MRTKEIQAWLVVKSQKKGTVLEGPILSQVQESLGNVQNSLVFRSYNLRRFLSLRRLHHLFENLSRDEKLQETQGSLLKCRQFAGNKKLLKQ